MLNAIYDLLVEHGLLASGGECRFAAQLTMGNNFLVNVYVAGGRFFHVRAAEDFDLAREFDIARIVHHALGRFVPEPLCFARGKHFNCIVFEGLEFDAVPAKSLLASAADGRIGTELRAFFMATQENLAGEQGAALFVDEIERLRRHFDGTEWVKLLNDIVHSAELSPLWDLPGLPQHGDLALNNLGVGERGLVVYDWEDFGKSSLRGMDLAVLLASVCRFDAAQLRALRLSGPGSPAAQQPGWLAPCCHALGLRPANFWAAMPLYLLDFLRMKDLYSGHIRDTVGRAIVGLL